MLVNIDINEWFPVFDIRLDGMAGEPRDISTELYERWKQARDEFLAVQRELGNECAWA